MTIGKDELTLPALPVRGARATSSRRAGPVLWPVEAKVDYISVGSIFCTWPLKQPIEQMRNYGMIFFFTPGLFSIPFLNE